MIEEWLTRDADTKGIIQVAGINRLQEELCNDCLKNVFYETYKHNEEFIRYDSHCDSIRLLISGRAVSYTICDKGESLTNLYIPGRGIIMADMPSFLTRCLSEDGFRSHGPSTMIRMDRAEYEKQLIKNPELYKFILFLTRINEVKEHKQKNDLKYLLRDQRIEKFFKENPEFSPFLTGELIGSLFKVVGDFVGTYRTKNNLPKDQILS
jgi:hypothetical protein